MLLPIRLLRLKKVSQGQLQVFSPALTRWEDHNRLRWSYLSPTHRRYPRCQTIEMELDWDRRLSLMRHHTAVHIVGGAARKILGSHVWQAGADKTPDRGRLDITHWENVSRETLDEIEYVANQVVMENKKIHKR